MRVRIYLCKRSAPDYVSRISRHFLPTLLLCRDGGTMDLDDLDEDARRELLEHGSISLDPSKLGMGVEGVEEIRLVLEEE